jgi:hypothetical protein
MNFLRSILAAALFTAVSPSANAQSVTGQISGTVTDQGGSLIAGASVRLTHDLSKQLRSFITDGNGNFLFTGLVPGNYSVHVEQPGFKTYDQRAIPVSAEERVALRELRLAVGEVTSTIEVVAETSRVSTETSDRSILVGTQQIEDTPLAGRDYLGILRTLPGVQMVDTRDFTGWFSGPGNVVNGGQSGQFLVTLDGIGSQDSGAPGTGGYLAPSLDAIGEVKVLVSNFTAEYGARAGGQMNVSVKNGTNQYHGTAYYFWRHEMLSANEFFNNKNFSLVNGVPTALRKPNYRFQNPGGTIGGPLLIPGTNFNKDRTKLFFFFSEDYLHTITSGGVNSFNMPTALERIGDYSQTVTTTGVKIPIKDPTTGVVLPDNILPANRISPFGYAMMNLFPLPNTTDPTGRRGFNTQYQWNRDRPLEGRILRLDVNLGPRTTSYLRLMQNFQADRGVGATLNGGGNWGQFSSNYDIQSAGVVYTAIHTFRSNLINETTFGINRATQHTYASDETAFKAVNDLSSLKGPDGRQVTLPNFFGANYLNVIPNISFAANGAQSAGQSVTAPPAFSRDSRWPFHGTDQLTNVTNNITWIKKRHILKAGFYFEHNARNVSVYSTYNAAGSYWFGSDIANPYDTGYGISNMMAGTVQAYGEDNIKQVNHSRYNQVEWFVQDTYKVNRRLTFDLGMRFQILQPTWSLGATLGLFQGEAYDVNKSGQLLYPALVGGQKVALNPKTGAQYPFARATSFDPASYPANGLPYSGIVQFKDRFFNTPPVQYGPRVGFALDVFGNGKTAVRGGFGIFYGRAYGVDTIGATSAGVGPMAAPPAFRSPIYYNTTFTNLLATQGFYGSQNVNGGSQDYKNPTTYNWSFGIQQGLKYGIILDVSYVANVAHHGFGTANDANAVPPLTTWTPAGGQVKAYLDPTSASNGTGAFYATNLIRAMTKYVGYGSIATYTSIGESSYNSLQTSLNRRFGKRYQFGGNYTWSKTLTFSHQQWIPDSLTKNVINRPHAVNLNFGYDIPSSARLRSNRLMQAVFVGWHASGVGAIFSGTPLTVSCAASSAPIGYWTGTPTGGIPMRCQMKGDLFRTDDGKATGIIDQRLYYPFNSGSFALPAIDSLGFGNTPPTLTYGPGMVNFDVSMAKTFKIAERKTIEFRAEAFNVVNHFNPSNPNSALTFNYTNGNQTNANFGAITAAQHTARRMSGSLRFRF